MQQFRHAVQLMLGKLSPDVDVKCIDPTLGGHYTPFPQVRFSWLVCQLSKALLLLLLQTSDYIPHRGPFTDLRACFWAACRWLVSYSVACWPCT